jgi:beta-mannanase
MILGGQYDTQLTNWANTFHTFGQPMFVRPFSEMNGLGWTPYDYNGGVGGCPTYAGLIGAWRYMYNKVHPIASNVQFVWCPNTGWNDTKTWFDNMYPGDSYVDWVCLDGYNWGASSGGGWQTFTQVFRNSGYDSIGHIQALSAKPLMIGEVGCVEAGDGGAQKAAWITDMNTTQVPALPRIQAVLWFNQLWNTSDFRIESSAPAQSAFAAAVAAGLYKASYP